MSSKERWDKHTRKYMWINDYGFAELNTRKQREGCNKHRDNNQMEKEFSLETFTGEIFKAPF